MAKKLLVKTQTPTVELALVSAATADGTTDKVTVGFKRYPSKQVEKKWEEFTSISTKTDQDVVDFLRNEIVYFKDASVGVYDDATGEDVLVETIDVADSRTAAPVESFWGTPKECLAVLLDSYLESIPWKGPFIDGFATSLFNRDLSNPVKNS